MNMQSVKRHKFGKSLHNFDWTTRIAWHGSLFTDENGMNHSAEPSSLLSKRLTRTLNEEGKSLGKDRSTRKRETNLL